MASGPWHKKSQCRVMTGNPYLLWLGYNLAQHSFDYANKSAALNNNFHHMTCDILGILTPIYQCTWGPGQEDLCKQVGKLQPCTPAATNKFY